MDRHPGNGPYVYHGSRVKGLNLAVCVIITQVMNMLIGILCEVISVVSHAGFSVWRQGDQCRGSLCFRMLQDSSYSKSKHSEDMQLAEEVGH